MNDRFRLEIPATPAQLSSPAEIASLIKTAEREFRPLFEREMDTGDSRYTYVEGSLNVLYVDLQSGSAELEFETNYYAGCRDIDHTDEREVTVVFTCARSALVFDMPLPPAWLPAE